MSKSSKTENAGEVDVSCGNGLKFHHVHLYVDKLDILKNYKVLEDRLNRFCTIASTSIRGDRNSPDNVEKARKIWKDLGGNPPSTPRGAAGRDVVRQLLTGPGFRITGSAVSETTRSFRLSSRDGTGTKIIVTAPISGGLQGLNGTEKEKGVKYPHLSLSPMFRAVTSQKTKTRRPSIAVLSFRVDSLASLKRIQDNYAKFHPSLLCNKDILLFEKEKTSMLEVFAYYQGDVGKSKEDKGTIIRFLCGNGGLPGILDVKAQFDDTKDALPIYSDHWVSNVVSRTGFLKTLNDTLGFSPKVNFNAGVVAAGEAQIESTVTGNSSDLDTKSSSVALKDQSQIYLPINNALSEAGHVIQFLREIGQGVQHIANRCDDVVTLISRVNYYEAVTGEAFTFLRIPRSYYGRLTSNDLLSSNTSGFTHASQAEELLNILERHGVIDRHGICDLNVCEEQIRDAISKCKNFKIGDDSNIVKTVKRSRYVNLYKLLRDRLSESKYMEIVRNKILVDIQGKDVLYQIFTGNVLQREAGQEAPFFEFIQRVCHASSNEDTKIPPGCGGFGIRNFLTLFLSIEVSKAMDNASDSLKRGDVVDAKFEERRIELFTYQMDTSNPVLTSISDAMTFESENLDLLENCKDERLRKEYLKKAEFYRKQKEEGNRKLMEISADCKKRMKDIREAQTRARSE